LKQAVSRLVNGILKLLGYRLVWSNSGLLFSKSTLQSAIHELCTRADEDGLEALPQRHRIVVLAWAARGIIGNGGFRYYYEGGWRMAEVAAAYRTLGFEQAARACESTLRIFPACMPPRDDERRREIVQRTDFDQFEDEESKVYDVDWESLEAAIKRYMDRHPVDFGDVRP
jgi:hypothetical protein